MRGGSEWLKRMNVIDETDEIAIREVTKARNKLAHELGDALLGEGMPNLSELFPKLLSLIKKIEAGGSSMWRFRRVPISTPRKLTRGV